MKTFFEHESSVKCKVVLMSSAVDPDPDRILIQLGECIRIRVPRQAKVVVKKRKIGRNFMFKNRSVEMRLFLEP